MAAWVRRTFVFGHIVVPLITTLLLVLLLLLVATCGPNASHYRSVLDGLHIPSGWDLVHSTSAEKLDCPLAECPYAARYYRANGSQTDNSEEVKQIFTEGGFQIDTSFGECGFRGVEDCIVSGAKGSDKMDIVLFYPGSDEGLGIAEEGHIIIRITAYGKR